MQQHNQDAKDGVVFDTAAIKIGGVGIDLRQPAGPGTLADLINARFTTRYTRRRDGHLGYPVVDGGDYPDNSSLSPSSWLYGHGLTVTELLNTEKESAHYPVAGKARGTFNFNGSRVVWTGDRLLVLRPGNTAMGSHAHWNRDGGDDLSYGVPAMLPVMTDSTPPSAVETECLNGCITEFYRVNVWNSDGALIAQVIDRETGVLVFQDSISDASTTDAVDPVVFQSGSHIVCLWRDDADDELYLTSWTGVSWTDPTLVQADVSAFAVAVISGGFHLAWAVESTGAIKLGKYSGVSTQSTPYDFDTELVANGSAGPLALAVSPDGQIGVLWTTSSPDVLFQQFTPSAVAVGSPHEVVSDGDAWDSLTISCRALRATATDHPWVTYAGRDSAVYIKEILYTEGDYQERYSTYRHNSRLASHSFRVGDEVLCWLLAHNSRTHYLLAGVYVPQVVGIADRQVALTNETHGGVYFLPHVFPDFRDDTGYLFSWIRPFLTGVDYVRGGNANHGDLDFLPRVSTAHYGKSVYLSGSCVKNWDGQELLEAGFHDYPLVNSASAGEGTFDDPGDIYIRVYAVRHNNLGERFQSAAVTYGPFAVTGTSEVQTGVDLVIKTMPVTSTEDIKLEVWVTEVGGTTFYFHGSVDNNLNSATVDYALSGPVDITGRADPHETGIGQLEELEEWGPVGCSILTVVGDRMWSAGGQVPRGTIQYSKLKEPGEGVGHDDLAQFYEVDTTGKPITSIAGFNETVAAFQLDRVSLVPPPGPDNYGRGGYPAPQVVLADGASTHAGTATVPDGIVYWSSHGPMLLSRDLRTVNISAPVQPLALTMSPTGVRVDFDNSEVIWFTESGEALLVNYLDGIRWARWTGLPAAAVTEDSIMSPDGVLLVESEDAKGDNGRPYEFGGRLSWAHPEDLLQGHTRLRTFGFTGAYLGQHTMRFRVFYDGASLWAEEQRWTPETNNWLTSAETYENMTAAEIDALTTRSRSGRYGFNKRVARQDCERFAIEWSDIASDTPTHVPHEITVELGALPGHGRGVVSTFTGSVAR